VVPIDRPGGITCTNLLVFVADRTVDHTGGALPGSQMAESEIVADLMDQHVEVPLS